MRIPMSVHQSMFVGRVESEKKGEIEAKKKGVRMWDIGSIVDSIVGNTIERYESGKESNKQSIKANTQSPIDMINE